MRKKALFGILTSKLKEKQLLVVSGLEKIKPKTRELLKVMKALKLEVKNSKLKEKTLLILPKKTDNLILAGKNLENLVFCQADLLNSYVILSCQKLILMKEATPVLKKIFLGKT